MNPPTERRYGSADFRARGALARDGRLRAHASERRFGRIGVIQMEGQPLEIEAPGPRRGLLALWYVFLGEGDFCYLDGGQWVEPKARFLMMPGWLQRPVRVTSAWQLTLVRIPWEALESFVTAPPEQITRFERRSLLDLSMEAFVTTLMRHGDSATSAESRATEQLLVEMGGAILLDQLSGIGRDEGDPHAVLRDRAMAVIARRCADPHVTPATVAREVQVSLRHEPAACAAGHLRDEPARVARTTL